MMNIHSRYTVCFSLSALLTQAAIAQQESKPQLEEIIVTAQKREQNLQDVPIAMSAFSGDSLVSAGISDLGNLNEVIPGLNVTTSMSGAQIYLRGVGSGTVSAGAENSVASYIDNVYISAPNAALLSTHNLAQVEVAKGPQGTLFGRNATGGVIHYKTLDPLNEFGGKAEAGYATGDTINGSIYLTGGITDTLSADILAVGSTRRDGYGINHVTGTKIGLHDTFAVRSKWLFEPTKNDQIRLILDYGEHRGNELNAFKTAEGTYNQVGSGTETVADRPDLLALQAAGELPHPFIPAGPGAAILPLTTVVGQPSTQIGSFHDLNALKDPHYANWQGGGSLQWDHEFDSMSLVSITAYREDFSEQDWAPIATGSGYHQTAGWIRDTDQFSQEVQLISAEDSTLQWVAGLFYMDANQGYDRFYLRGSLVELTSPSCAPPPLGAGDCTAHDETVFASNQSTESYASFGEASYPILENTNLTLGARYTHEERGLTTPPEGGIQFFVENPALGQTPANAGVLDGQGIYTFGVNGSLDISKTFTQATYRVSLDHHFNEDLMAYASFNQGFKSGVYNSIPAQPGPPAEPELLDAYEVGFKSSLANDTLSLNGAFFYYDYNDLQVSVFRAAVASIENAATAEIYGLDLEALWLATENLQFRANINWLDTEFTSYPEGLIAEPRPLEQGGGVISTSGDLSGNQLVQAAEFSGNIMVNYTVPLNNGAEINFNSNVSYSDDYFFTVDNALEQPSIVLWNISASYKMDNGAYLEFWGKNILDEEYWAIGLSTQTDPGGSVRGRAAPPATYGFRVGTAF